MLKEDLVFARVLADAGVQGQPFQPLTDQLRGSDVETKELMLEALVRILHSAEASAGNDLVLIWAVESPFVHADGNRLPSTIVYIEKMAGSIRGRWSARSLANLAEDFLDRPLTNPNDLRHLAKQNRNFSFYKRMSSEYGPLSLWQVGADVLNNSSSLSAGDSRVWENRILSKYFEHHRCLPLKNRQL